MNKYQEPFNNIVVEAELMAERCGHKLEEDIKLVQELVDKATPKKPVDELTELSCGIDDTMLYYEYYCPICGAKIANSFLRYHDYKFCHKCGNAIDWSEEE